MITRDSDKDMITTRRCDDEKYHEVMHIPRNHLHMLGDSIASLSKRSGHRHGIANGVTHMWLDRSWPHRWPHRL